MTTSSKTLEFETKMGDFAQTFAAFREANDARLAEIESKSAADPLLSAKVDRLNAALDAQSRQLDHLSLSAAAPTGAVVESEAKSAWSTFIRSGQTVALEAKSLSSTYGDGGYIAPVETQTQIDRVLSEASPMRRLATVRMIGSGVFKKPVSLSGAASGWAGETALRSETDAPQLELLDFPMGELYAMPAATQVLLDDSVADVDAWLADEVRDVFSAQESAAFINGDGINKPKGFLSYTQADEGTQGADEIGTVSTGVAGGFDATNPVDALIDLIYAPRSRYRAGASFVMNRRTVNEVRKFKDADGNYIWQPATTAGAPSTLLGYPLVEMEDMPDVSSGQGAIAFGDFRRGYLIADRQSVRVLRDPYSAKPYVLFYTTKRVGGGVQDFDAIKVLKTAA